MKPVDFAGRTHVLAKDQPQYQPLPVHVSDEPDYVVTSCWQLSWGDLFQLALNRRQLFVQQLTFGRALQPQLLTVKNPVAG